MNASLPVALYTAAQSRILDAEQIAAGTSGFTLMQRAAQAAWQALYRRWPQWESMTVLAGGGNNAGDGYLIACLAARAGWQVRVLSVDSPERLEGDAAQAYREAKKTQGVHIRPWEYAADLEGVLVDALLGTGLQGKVRAPYDQVIDQINAADLPVLSVDIPSGLCADTGQVLGCAVRADLTVSFIGLKLGLLTGVGPDHSGSVVFDDLQLDTAVHDRVAPAVLRLDEPALTALPPRNPTSHKAEYGHLLVVGGDLGTGGAALMAAESGLRSGAGMVTLVTRPEHLVAALVRAPEVMVVGLESSYALEDLAAKASVVLIGPGLGQAPWGRSLLSALSRLPVPQVWDADALNLLASGSAWIPHNSLMTPHPGEAARLLDCSVKAVQANRPEAARMLAQRYDCVAVLKGAGTIIADPDGRLMLCDRGHPAMATAGLGDVLSGTLAALLAQGMPCFDAACLGVWLHAVAGERAGVLGRGLAATDLIPLIREVLEEQSPCRR